MEHAFFIPSQMSHLAWRVEHFWLVITGLSGSNPTRSAEKNIRNKIKFKLL